jgi:hypothetical protein
LPYSLPVCAKFALTEGSILSGTFSNIV